ncbi:hypothetical protein ACOSP7_010037 [Xanthoceras sorbifolium]
MKSERERTDLGAEARKARCRLIWTKGGMDDDEVKPWSCERSDLDGGKQLTTTGQVVYGAELWAVCAGLLKMKLGLW